MKANQARFKISTMARVFGVSRAGYYAWKEREPSARSTKDAVLTEQITTIHRDARRTYGSRRILAELRATRSDVGRRRVQRLMRAAELRTITRRRFVKTTRRDHKRKPEPDLVERRFDASRPDQLWVADITYVPTDSGFLFLAVVLDVFSRRVVGWAMDTHMRTELVERAVRMAAHQRKVRGVIHHSDQGSQYTSFNFGRTCRAMGITRSMGSVGDCYDNALCESFFASLECELLQQTRFSTPANARQAVFAWIEGWYNTRRRHSSIQYMSPVDFENKHSQQTQGISTACQSPPGPPSSSHRSLGLT